MKIYEIISLILSSTSVLLVGIGLLYTAKRLKVLIKTNADNHEWNRRYATQLELSRFYQANTGGDALNMAFQHIERTEQISIHEINKKFEQIPDLKIATYRLLSFYESLARGIFQGIYDEEVVRESQQNEMIRIYEIFKNLIEARRKQVDRETYDNFEKAVNCWKSELTPSNFREKTGTL